MSELLEVRIPDLGGADGVEVVEDLVASGTVREIHLEVGTKIQEGDPLLTLESDAGKTSRGR